MDSNQNNQSQQPQQGNQQPVDNSTVMAVLAYLGILIIIPYLMAKDSPFVKFHIKQGLVLLIIEAIYYLLTSFSGAYVFFTFSGIWGMILTVVSLALLVLIVMGIINAAQRRERELPIVGFLARNFNI